MPRKNELSLTICRLYKNTISGNILPSTNNGHMSEEFLLEKGGRQGCPVSFLLYCIQNNIFPYNILKDKEIKGFNIPGRKEKLKLSQYADDTSFISSNFKDLPLLFDKFSKYEKATGCTGCTFNIPAGIREIQEYAKTQSQRNLSLKGKMILSKLWFTAIVFPILKDLIPKEIKIMFGYLWKGSAAEPIAPETLCL